jgi:hypothetical protein
MHGESCDSSITTLHGESCLSCITTLRFAHAHCICEQICSLRIGSSGSASRGRAVANADGAVMRHFPEAVHLPLSDFKRASVCAVMLRLQSAASASLLCRPRWLVSGRNCAAAARDERPYLAGVDCEFEAVAAVELGPILQSSAVPATVLAIYLGSPQRPCSLMLCAKVLAKQPIPHGHSITGLGSRASANDDICYLRWRVQSHKFYQFKGIYVGKSALSRA